MALQHTFRGRSNRFAHSHYTTTIATVLIIGFLYFCLTVSKQSPISFAASKHAPVLTLTPNVEAHTSTRILKLSMHYGKPNLLYERALRTHQAHAARWGHGFNILREDLATGFWNKPTFMLNMLIQEMAKPAHERAEWLLWVDADSIIINPSVSPAIFLPPGDLSHIHVVATHDHNGLNTGIFFLKVDAWSVAFLIETLGMPLYKKEVDLGRSADQEAMAMVLNKTTGGPNNHGYRNGVVYVPRSWINKYELDTGFEGDMGDMLVHFPGLEDARWPHMATWLDLLDARPKDWDRELNETNYWNSTRNFWQEYRSSLRLLSDIGDPRDSIPEPTNKLLQAVLAVKNGLEVNADNLTTMRRLRGDVYYELKLARPM